MDFGALLIFNFNSEFQQSLIQMIARTIIRRALLLRYLAAPTASILSTPKFHFSRKVQKAPTSFTSILDTEIKAEESNLTDLTQREADFKTKGWTISRENTLIELSKDTGKYHVRLLSNIKSPSNINEGGEQNKDSQQQPEEEQFNGDMNEVSIFITKNGQEKTMVVNAIVTEGFEITNVTFAESPAAAKKQRLDIFSTNTYTGPEMDTISDQLFQAIYGFLQQECQVSNEVLTNLADYCLDSEQQFYIGWLKDLKNIV